MSSKVKLVVMFKEDRNVMRAKESTELWKIKKKLATHYNLGSRGLVLKHLGGNIGDDRTTGRCHAIKSTPGGENHCTGNIQHTHT